MNTQTEIKTKLEDYKSRTTEAIRVKVTTIVERLTVFIEPIKSWFATNWTKVTQYVEGTIISESTVYRSRCWNCKTPIKSVKREHKIATWIGNKWLGNKMCESPNCTYFICVKCSKCLCDSHYYKRPRFVVQKNWEVEEKQNTVGKIVAYFSGEKMEIENSKNQKRRPINF